MEKPSKSRVRKKFLDKRNQLDPEARIRDSAIIRQRVIQHADWQNARTVLCYVSYQTEVETLMLIQEALRQGKRVVVPVMLRSTKKITLSELQALGDLASGGFLGIQEPATDARKAVDPLEVELALVPGVAFDQEGGRIGMGGGHFDRLLARMPRARRIGLAFSIQISPAELPLSHHDIRMHTVVTEKEVIGIQ